MALEFSCLTMPREFHSRAGAGGPVHLCGASDHSSSGAASPGGARKPGGSVRPGGGANPAGAAKPGGAKKPAGCPELGVAGPVGGGAKKQPGALSRARSSGIAALP